jgi:hypothetical protein
MVMDGLIFIPFIQKYAENAFPPRHLAYSEWAKKMVRFWWLVRAARFRGAEGCIKWFGTCTDIQNIKRNRIELLKAKEHAEETD